MAVHPLLQSSSSGRVCPVNHRQHTGSGDAGPEAAAVEDPHHRSSAGETAAAAARFLHEHAEETGTGTGAKRVREALREIDRTGTYQQTFEELQYGARVAWRNSTRCIGRLYWQSLQVRDLRHLTDPEDIFHALVSHLRDATNAGRIRPIISIFASTVPPRQGPRIWNEQLVRYAGYRRPDGDVVGDPRYVAFTERVEALGWRGAGGRFDVLPIVIETPDGQPRMFDLPPSAVHEVPLSHPEYRWFADLRLRWHAVPVVADMHLEIGGIHYPAAPFNGWYMGTEIGARNLADEQRYNLLPVVADGMGLDRSDDRTLWKDRALVELNRAVLHSFGEAGVRLADHHTEARRFLLHIERERCAGREVPADWSWIVPPMSGAATPVFHRLYDNLEHSPRLFRG